MAVCARSLARRTGHRNPEEAFTVGLVTHIGIMIMLNVVGKEYLEFLKEKFYHSKNLNILEREAYQTDHAEVGYFLLSRWNFPEIIKETVKHHDSEQILSSSNERLVEIIKIIQVAEKIAGFFVSENPILNEDIIRLCKQFFDMAEGEVEEFLQHIKDETNDAASLLGIDKILDKSYEQIYKSAIGKLADLNLKHDELNKNLRELEKEHKRAEQEKIQLEKLGALGRLVGGIAHELNNPMTGMLNFIGYCLKHTSKDNKIYPILEDTKRETERCAKIVGNLLTFSRMDKEDEETYIKKNITLIFGRVFNLLSYRIEKENILLTQEYSKETPEIWMKASNMQQVILNLMGNALDAVKESEEKEIHVETCPNGKFVRVTITDSGCGISPENFKNIFDPFFTTKPPGQGTGLGLSVSRSIVKAHGGKITCESEVGKGTKFSILLPMDRRS
jgi:signal transduction histidine kinase